MTSMTFPPAHLHLVSIVCVCCVHLQDSKAYFHLLEQIAPDGSREDVPKVDVEMCGVFVSDLQDTVST